MQTSCGRNKGDPTKSTTGRMQCCCCCVRIRNSVNRATYSKLRHLFQLWEWASATVKGISVDRAAALAE